MIHHVEFADQELLLHTDQETAARKAAELWVDYDMRRLNEMRKAERHAPDFHAATYGRVGFRHVKPQDPQPYADTRLNERLQILCEQLRARY